MPFDIITVRTADQEDGRMYPVLGDDRFPLEVEDLDGPDLQHFVASAVHVHEVGDGDPRPIHRLREVEIDVYITDARVAFCCKRYDKGGGWQGTSLAVPVVNAASRARAAGRRRGKLLVGHVRYPWVMRVGAQAKSGWGGIESVRLVLNDKTGERPRQLALDLVPERKGSATFLAEMITARTARYRLETDLSMDDDERRAFERLLAPPPLAPAPKTLAWHQMPTHYPATFATAYPVERP